MNLKKVSKTLHNLMFLILRNQKNFGFYLFRTPEIKRGIDGRKKDWGLFYSSAPSIVTVYSKFSVFLGRIESVHFPAVPGTV